MQERVIRGPCGCQSSHERVEKHLALSRRAEGGKLSRCGSRTAEHAAMHWVLLRCRSQRRGSQVAPVQPEAACSAAAATDG